MKNTVEIIARFDRGNAAFEDNHAGQIDIVMMKLRQTLGIAIDAEIDCSAPLYDQNGNNIGAVAVNFSS